MSRVMNRINKANRDKTINRMERQIRGLNAALRSAEERIKKFKDFEKEQKKYEIFIGITCFLFGSILTAGFLGIATELFSRFSNL
jgi:hypothetical protein